MTETSDMADDALALILAEEAEKYVLSAGYYCTLEDARKIRAASLQAMRRAYELNLSHSPTDSRDGALLAEALRECRAIVLQRAEHAMTDADQRPLLDIIVRADVALLDYAHGFITTTPDTQPEAKHE